MWQNHCGSGYGMGGGCCGGVRTKEEKQAILKEKEEWLEAKLAVVKEMREALSKDKEVVSS